jgi:hypothetical protein
VRATEPGWLSPLALSVPLVSGVCVCYLLVFLRSGCGLPCRPNSGLASLSVVRVCGVGALVCGLAPEGRRPELVARELRQVLAQPIRRPRGQNVLDLAALNPQALGDVAQHVWAGLTRMVVYLEGDRAAFAVVRFDLDAEEEAVFNAPALVGQAAGAGDEFGREDW